MTKRDLYKKILNSNVSHLLTYIYIFPHIAPFYIWAPAPEERSARPWFGG